MDNLPPSIPPIPSPEPPNHFPPIGAPSSSRSLSSAATTHETISRNSNSPISSTSSVVNQENLRSTPTPTVVGNFVGTPVSISPIPALSSRLRNRIIAATPGTSAFAAEIRRGSILPARALQAGLPAATLAAAEQRRNPQPINVAAQMNIQNPNTPQILAQNRLQQKTYFSPPKTAPKRTD